jgi:NADP-dependent 3-hydroxy acid dehydrogenase YdfG
VNRKSNLPSFKKEKANIIIAARNDSEIKETMEKLKKMSSNALAIHADVRNEEDVKESNLKNCR